MLQISCVLNKNWLHSIQVVYICKNHLALGVCSLLTSSCKCHHHATCGQSSDYQSLRQGCKKGSKRIKTKLSERNSLSCHVSVVTLKENANSNCSCRVENNRQLKILNDFFLYCTKLLRNSQQSCSDGMPPLFESVTFRFVHVCSINDDEEDGGPGAILV